jgi:hypothetical protein
MTTIGYSYTSYLDCFPSKSKQRQADTPMSKSDAKRVVKSYASDDHAWASGDTHTQQLQTHTHRRRTRGGNHCMLRLRRQQQQLQQQQHTRDLS